MSRFEEEYLKEWRERSRPQQYAKGIDTFERMESNMSPEGILAFCVGNIDKYIWRDKGSDLEDFKKARDYIDLAIKTMENQKGKS